MDVLWWQENPPPISGSGLLTIGNFDGFHKGHRALVNKCRELQRDRAGDLTVLTFTPHPSKTLSPDNSVQTIYTPEDMISILEQENVDRLVFQTFDVNFSRLSASQFFERVLSKLSPLGLVVGEDFRFGAQGVGDVKWLEKQCHERGLIFSCVPRVKYNGRAISSTWIRELLKAGDIKTINELLTQPYFIRGPVISGDKRGRDMGAPTVNIKQTRECLPKYGVYIGEVQHDKKFLPAVANIGENPTFQESSHPIKVEAHILETLDEYPRYGENVVIRLFDFIREEKRFSSVAQLQNQIENDIKKAKRYFDV